MVDQSSLQPLQVKLREIESKEPEATALQNFLNSNEAKNVEKFKERMNRFASYLRTRPQLIKEFTPFIKEADKVMKNLESTVDSDCPTPFSGKEDATFESLAGMEREKNEVREAFIYPYVFSSLFQSPSKGLLLYGPGGTGKTSLVSASVNEIPNCAVFAIRPSDIKGSYEGETEKNITAKFKCARQILKSEPNKYRVAILFFDEFEALASSRSDRDPSTKRTVTALLQEMDGIDSDSNVAVIASTNTPCALDSAILRRFSSRVFVDLPDAAARRQIIIDKLAKSYSAPFQKDDKTDDPRPFWTNFVKYGGNNVLNRDNIDTIVSWTGPHENFRKQLVDESKLRSNKEKWSKDGDPVKESYGYSASDISKMLDKAINIAARRAIVAGSSYVRDGDNYVYVPLSSSKMPRVVHNINDIDHKQFRNLYTFNLTLDDIKEALTAYPSTINGKEYEDLVKYWSRGVCK